MPEQRSPLEISYAPGSYSSAEGIPVPAWDAFSGRSGFDSKRMLDQGPYLNDEDWERMKEEISSRPTHHLRKTKIDAIISYMDKQRAANADRPRVPTISDTRNYWEDFIRRETERRRESKLEGGPSLPHPGMRP